MKQEYILAIILGLFISAYVLDAAVKPLSLPLSTPYQYFSMQYLSLYPFSTVSIVAKAIALFITFLKLLSYINWNSLTKGAVLFAVAGLLQLYALQDVATKARVIPLEWSLAFTLTGITLLLPALLFILFGGAKKAYKSFADDPGIAEESPAEKG